LASQTKLARFINFCTVKESIKTVLLKLKCEGNKAKVQNEKVSINTAILGYENLNILLLLSWQMREEATVFFFQEKVEPNFQCELKQMFKRN
jgi:hypothetical protein